MFQASPLGYFTQMSTEKCDHEALVNTVVQVGIYLKTENKAFRLQRCAVTCTSG
jgi:hypothetical protein